MSELPSIFIDILAPVFIVVAVGVVIGRRMSLDHRPLARVAYYVLAPAFIFEVLASSAISGSTAARMVIVLAATSLGVAALAAMVGRALGRARTVTVALVLVAVFGNVGNFGLPIVAFEFGEDALDLAGIAFLTVGVIAFLIGVTAATWEDAHPARALFTAFTTPAILVVPPALFVNVTSSELPLFADRVIGLLAGALIPIMLLALGMQLAAMERVRVNADVIIGSSLRLLVAPALAALLAALVGLTGTPAGVTILQSAMPAAVFTVLIAMEHDLEPELITTTVLVSTVVSALTLSVVLLLV